MPTKIINGLGKQYRRAVSRQRYGAIILSAVAFAIGFLILLSLVPAPQRDDAALETDANQIVAGP